MHYNTLTDWQRALIATERHGWQLTWGDAATVLYLLVMVFLGCVFAIALLGG